MNSNTKHGGARPGAGRPVEVEGARRVNVTLDAATIGAAKRIGDGNLSAGIRKAVRQACKGAPKEKGAA